MKELTPEEIRAITESRRGFLKQDASDEPEGYKTDQQKMLPQPPLTKAPVSDTRIDLPRDFKPAWPRKRPLKRSFSTLLSALYGREPALWSFGFTWATQGVNGIRGKKYATLRTVPCGGARHPFETYLLVRRVEGLKPGKIPLSDRSKISSSISVRWKTSKTSSTSPCAISTG